MELVIELEDCFLAAKHVPQLLLQKQKAIQDFHEKTAKHLHLLPLQFPQKEMSCESQPTAMTKTKSQSP